MKKDVVKLAKSVRPLKVELKRGGTKKAAAKQTKPYSMSDEDYSAELKRRNLRPQRDPNYSLMNLMFSNPDYQDYLKSKDQEYSLNEPQMDLFPEKSGGGEVKDPTKRALFNMFKPQESNLPAVAAPAPALNPTAPEPAEATSEPSPDILGKAAEKLSATPMSRRGFMETARNAVAAARMAPKIKKLAKAEKVAAPAIDPKKAIRKILTEKVDLEHPIMKGLRNGTVPFDIEDLYPDHFNHDPEDVPGMEHMNSDEIGYELMENNPRRVIDFINGGEEHIGYMDEELSNKLFDRFNSHVKEKLENKIGRKVSEKEFKELIEDANDDYDWGSQDGTFNEMSQEELDALHERSLKSIKEMKALQEESQKDKKPVAYSEGHSFDEELYYRAADYIKPKLEQEIGRKISDDEFEDLLTDANNDYDKLLQEASKKGKKFSGGGSADDDHPEHYRELNDLGLYSKAAEVAQDATGQNESMTPDQWVNYLTQRDVKPDELKWSDLHFTYGKNNKVHKNDVASYFNELNDAYTEQLYTGDPSEYSGPFGLEQLAHDMANDPGLFKQVLPQAHLFEHAKRKEAAGESVVNWLTENWDHELENYIKKQKNFSGHLPTRHSGYEMDGPSKNYRELVLQHDPETKRFQEHAHFPDAVNPLLHIRMSDRKGANGEKLLHIEELQSDWGQRGAYAGFNEADKAKLFKKFTEADRALYQFDFAFRNKIRNLASSRPDGGALNRYADNAPLSELIMPFGDVDDQKEYKRLKKDHQKSLARSQAPRVEAGPHVDDTNKWVDLGLKRILKEAADGGYHGIVFTPGNEQAQRWGNDRRLIKPYDETLPSRMQKLINKHDPSLKFGKYSYNLLKEYSDDPDYTVHHLPMSDKAIASIKKGQERFQRGGEVEGFGDGGTPSLAARRAEAQAYIKDLVEKRKKYPKGSPDYDFYTQQIAEQSKIVNEKGASSPPPKAAVAEVGHNRPPREMNVLGTYSHAAEVAENAPKSEMTPQDWVNYLKGQPGVTKDELKWAELEKLKPFGDSKTISKQRVAQRLNDVNKEDYEENVREAKYFKDDVQPKTSLAEEMLGNPKLMKKVLGQYFVSAITNLKDIDEDEENKKLFTSSQLLAKKRTYLLDEHEDEIRRYLQKIQPKFERYTLKGKDENDNYREHVLQWKPERDDFKYSPHFPESNPLFHLRFADVYDVKPMTNDEVVALYNETYPRTIGRSIEAKNIGSGFLSQMKEKLPKEEFDRLHAWWLQNRYPGDKQFGEKPGKKYLHLEEAQSDWGQKGRGKFMDADEIENAKNEFYLADNEHDEAEKKFHEWFNQAQEKHFKQYKDQAKKKKEELKMEELYNIIHQSTNPEEIKQAEEDFKDASYIFNRYHHENYDKVRNAWSDFVNSNYAGTEGEELHRKRIEASKKYFEAQMNYEKAKDATPEGPYVGDTDKWTKVMVKKILHEMAKGGYDGLIVTPGSEQSKRWSGQPGVKKFYDETLLPEIQRQMASHDKNTGKSAIYKFPVESKTKDHPEVEDVREMLGMPAADISRVADVWNNLQEHQRARYWNDYVAAGKNVTSTTVDLPLFKTTPQANESIMNNQKAWRRGGMVDRPIAKSEKIKHNPAIIEQALNKIRSLPQVSDSPLSGKQGRLF